MRHLIILTALTILFVECKEKVIVTKEIEIVKSWTSHVQFDELTKIETNSFATDKLLFIYGPDFFSSIDETNQVSHAFTRLDYPKFFRLPISKNCFLEAEGKWLRFANTEHPVYDEGAASIDLQALDPSFKEINFGNLYQIGAIDINENGQCLVPIYTESTDNTIVAYLFNTSLKDGIMIEISDTIKISILNPSPTQSQSVSCVKGVKDYFIISVESGTFKIYGNGDEIPTYIRLNSTATNIRLSHY